MKNKRGFTLAEVLITIGILGIIAAITLPALHNDINKNTWATGLKTNIAMLNTAFNQILVEEDVSDIRDTNLWTNNVTSEDIKAPNDDIKKEMQKHFKIEKTQANYPQKAYTLSGDEYKNESTRFYLGNSTTLNIVFKYNPSYSACTSSQEFCHPAAEIVLDVNGDKGPNTMGKDMFLLLLGENGVVYPAGSDAAYNYKSTTYPKWDSEEGCKGKDPKEVDGTACAGRVVDEGYKINY